MFTIEALPVAVLSIAGIVSAVLGSSREFLRVRRQELKILNQLDAAWTSLACYPPLGVFGVTSFLIWAAFVDQSLAVASTILCSVAGAIMGFVFVIFGSTKTLKMLKCIAGSGYKVR